MPISMLAAPLSGKWFDEVWEGMLEKMRVMVQGWIIDLMDDVFESMNDVIISTSEIAAKTPGSFNSTAMGVVENICKNVIFPVAVIFLTYFFCLELIGFITEKNNMQDVEIQSIGISLFKTAFAVIFLSKTWEITMAFFDLAGELTRKAAQYGTVSSNLGSDFATAVQSETDLGKLVIAVVCAGAAWILRWVIKIFLLILMYGRFIEIYLYCSQAPIPFSTFLNKEWSQMGNNYLRGLLAYAMQGLLMFTCIVIYSALVGSITTGGDDITWSLFENICYGILLCLALKNTKELTKSIYNAH